MKAYEANVSMTEKLFLHFIDSRTGNLTKHPNFQSKDPYFARIPCLQLILTSCNFFIFL